MVSDKPDILDDRSEKLSNKFEEIGPEKGLYISKLLIDILNFKISKNESSCRSLSYF